jgi:hypothetical protein
MSGFIESNATVAIKLIPLPAGRPEVEPFSFDLLPTKISNFIRDNAERLQCPPDYIAVTALCSMAAVLGNKAFIYPKQHDNWKVTPNLWGAIIGRPSAKKTPAMKVAINALEQIEKGFKEKHDEALLQYKIETRYSELSLKNADKKAQKLIDKSKSEAKELIADAYADEVEQPVLKRIVVNDTTVEKLGDLLAQNPNGLMIMRDELSGLLSKLNKEEFQGDRAFYLECFDGDATYKVDRIKRGTVVIDNCTLSLIGGIQPSKLAPIIRGAVNGINDDGLIQRLQLAVWPDESKSWRWVDQKPDENALMHYEACFEKLMNYTPEDKVHRFNDEAQQLFINWMEETNKQIISENISPIMASYMLKLPKSISAIALIIHILNSEDGDLEICAESIAMALDWSDYLISHANRIFSWASNSYIDAAKLLIKRRNKLPAMFKCRDICQKNWTGLTNAKEVYEAIELLIDHNYLLEFHSNVGIKGGRPSITYCWSNATEA